MKDFYEKETAIKILENEDKYVGRMFKKYDEQGHCTYIRVVSAITMNAPYNVRCFEFEYPVNIKFWHMSNYRAFRGYGTSFDFGFDGEPFAWTDEENISDLNNEYEEVSMLDWQNTWEHFCDCIQKLFTNEKQWTIESIFGTAYKAQIEEKKDEEEKKE